MECQAPKKMFFPEMKLTIAKEINTITFGVH